MGANERRKGRKGGGRRARIEARSSSAAAATPGVDRKVPCFELLPEETLELIEHNADLLLEEIGVEFREVPEALELFAAAGADVDGERVRFAAGLCRSLVTATAPAEFIQHARNPERSVTIGGDRTVFAPAYGSPFVRDLASGRRYATLEDFRNFVKLAYLLPSLHHSGGTICEPVDIPVEERHLDMLHAHVRFSDKPLMGSVTAPSRAADSVAMMKHVFGPEFVDSNTVLTSLINVNSPLVFDRTMMGAARVYAENNQATIISPFVLAGAMSPVTVMGTLTQILAEALAGMAYVQLVRPGAPVIFGMFASAVSMQSGAPTFGTPEPSLMLLAGGQLARRLGVPFRSGGCLCSSKIPDAQAAYESANTLQMSALSGVNFMLHAAGWLEGGLCMGYEKFIMDADQLGMLSVLLGGVDTSANGQALDAFREVGPGAHFLGSAHTLANFERAFYRSALADNNSFEQWQADGEKDCAMRAAERCEALLESYEPPPLDAAVDEAVSDFIARRKSEIQAAGA
ncbi:MAG: trimethylamine methyltransferase [Xanthomonadales bacterium]|nr:trimethylamine methyltransferase [Xanthomonadales bacterium]NIN58396.1 trimethylamine methyltransferase [Xanthomonadales bacterium]NIN73733.1 trimethylamine methyltransferase [Xanthomonadales bacterium]NIO14531.1 trimethylamine methyltransferase [Xanthomonadales bacterium]NIP10789.1 trimethylamine methyltransferase [Xanthomonadales bacterium]